MADLLVMAGRHPGAANQTLLVSDGEDVSTVEMMRRLAGHMGRPFPTWPLPPAMLRFLARCSGRLETFDKLFGSLTVDSRNTRKLLDWVPPYSLDEELAASAKWYLKEVGSA